MLIYDFETRLNQQGYLEVPLPGYGNAITRILSWKDGFETFEIKNDQAIEKTLWTLEVFPRRERSAPSARTDRFFSDIPLEISDQVRRFEFGQCAMLRWAARYPEARDLCHANPKLLWLLATAVFDSAVEEVEISNLLRQKQVEILGRILRPASRSTLRTLQKVALVNGDLKEARDVIRALAKPMIRRIVAHHEAVTPTLLRILYDHPILASPSVASCLKDAFERTDCHPGMLAREVSDTIRDIRRMAEVLGIENSDQAIDRCHWLGDLYRLHERWVDNVNRRQDHWMNGELGNWLDDPDLPYRLDFRRDELEQYVNQCWTFPDPPFPDSREIRAIRSARELFFEARVQKNCVWSYGSVIAGGKVCIYKVLSPHRATLELRNSESGWEIGQFKLSCNRSPGPEVEGVVKQWLVNCTKQSSR